MKSNGNPSNEPAVQSRLADRLSKALVEVRRGRLTPEQAAKNLLASAHQGAHQGPSKRGSPVGDDESLLAISLRLGRPPADIWQQWRDQIDAIALVHESVSGEPLPPLDLSRWCLDADGRVIWLDQTEFAPSDPSLEGSPLSDNTHLSETSRRRIDDFEETLFAACDGGLEVSGTDSDNSGEAAERVLIDPLLGDEGEEVASGPAERKRQMAEKFAKAIAERQGRPVEELKKVTALPVSPKGKFGTGNQIRNLTYFASGLLALGVLVGIIVNSLKEPAAPVARSTTGNSTDGADAGSLLDSARASKSTRESENAFEQAEPSDETGELQMFQPGDLDLGQSIDSPTLVLPDAAPMSISQPNTIGTGILPEPEPADGDGTKVEPDDATEPEVSMAETMLAMDAELEAKPMNVRRLDDANAEMAEEQPQPTNDLLVSSVLLPPKKETATPVPFAKARELPASLQFPYEVRLELRTSEDRSVIVDKRRDTPVGTFSITDESEVQFNWAPEAMTASSSGLLPHGRVEFPDGALTYLRPRVEAAPLKIDFQNDTLHPSWELHAALPRVASRLDIEIVTPEEIEHAWITSYEPDSPRRTSGFLVLAPTDDENIAAAVKMDLKCGTQFSCRMRLGGRLDSTLPWQFVSHASMDEQSDYFANAIVYFADQKTLMDARYDRANTAKRRLLRPFRDQIDEGAENWQLLAQRLQEFRALVARIEREVEIRFRISVQWSDDEDPTEIVEQTIFMMTD